jgi:NAD(P)H-quinone oxidoreductase subunit 5
MNFTDGSAVVTLRASSSSGLDMTLSSLLPGGLSGWHALLLVLPSVAAFAAALYAGPRRAPSAAWAAAGIAAATAVVASVGGLVLVVVDGGVTGFGLRADLAGGIVQTLAALVGAAILRYARPYLAGSPRETAAARGFGAALAAVFLVTVADALWLLALAWSATGFALHGLLRYFEDRPAAVVAAHKQRIVSVAADVCMIAAVGLLAAAFGTTSIAELGTLWVARESMPVVAQVAAVLVAAAALLRCAQLPAHGWLIQVMEAPTPVSALLHAGVVNLGGFVLIRIAPLIDATPVAQGLLVAVGTATAVVAALVATTRVSIKVALAWSTCAQMGFMLMQCGLGAWEMALLHLVAHSLYKAHAFLGSGGAVRSTLLREMAPVEAPASVRGLAAGSAVAMLAVGAAAAATSPWLHATPATVVLAGVVALSLVPLARPGAGTAFAAFAVAFAWFGLHALVDGRLVGDAAAPQAAWWALVAFGFAVLYALRAAIRLAPRGALAARLWPWCYGGFFLDEHASRLMFRLWPPPSPAAPATPPAAVRAPQVRSTLAAGARS